MKININKQLLYNFLLSLTGLVYIIYYIWFRFVRERLPKDIPFHLNFITFLILILTILGLSYSLYRTIKPKMPPVFFITLFNKLYIILRPLEFFDDILKKKPIIKNLILEISSHLIKSFKLFLLKNNLKLFFILNYVPKILIMLCFFISIIFFNNLHIFYSSILFSIIPLTFKYFIYTLKKQLEISLSFLEKNYKVKVLSTAKDEDHGKDFMFFINNLKYNFDNTLDVRYFVKIQADNLYFDCDQYEYTGIETAYARQEYAKKHNIELPPLWIFEPQSDNISKILFKDFNYIMPKVIFITAFLYAYQNVILKELKKFDIYILIGFLIGWLYILLVSLPTLDIQNISELLFSINVINEPFSELNIYEYVENFKYEKKC